MDLETLRNQVKTRIRNYFWTHSWYKKVIPAAILHRYSTRIMDQIQSKTTPPRPYTPGVYPDGVNLYGFFKAENGLAQGVKLYALALEEAKIPHVLLNTSFLDWLSQQDETFDDQLQKKNRYAVNVVHINPDQWQEAVGNFPKSQFDGHYNIGVFLWELEVLPDRWIPIFDQVDEVWTPSEYTAGALRKATDKPVTVLPYGIVTPCDETLTRRDFGLDEDDFAVLMMFDSNSFAARKNPAGAIAAFREAFGDHPAHVKLVIKINNPTDRDVEMIKGLIPDPDSRVIILERMERTKLNRLISLCDVFISLHRSEGFGLVMAEAMSLGTAVIATNWSSNTEFMPPNAACMVDYRLVPVGDAYQFDNGSLVWADADVHQAAGYLKRLHDDPAYCRQIAEAGQQYIREHVSVAASAEKIRNRLEEILHGSGQGTTGEKP